MSLIVKPRILVISPFYLPGYQSGALRTLANLVECLGDEFEFYVITEDHDVNDQTPYTDVEIDAWNNIGKAKVFYLSAKSRTWKQLKKLYREIQPDAVYLNSFFFPAVIQYLTMRRFGLIEKKPTIITPKGELSAGALKVKAAKKKMFLASAELTGIYKDLIWQASVEDEQNEIRKTLKVKKEVFIVSDLPTKIYAENFKLKMKLKEAGKVRFVFLSRIDPKKNIKTAISMLKNLEAEVVFDIFGPVAFPVYWQECLNLIKELPPRVQVNYQGLVTFEKVLETLSDAHFFLMPTLGENFGHVVIESLSAGTPVILSDKTPWLNLQAKNIGWDLSLEDKEGWQTVLRKCADMDNFEYQKMSAAARNFALGWLAMPETENKNREILRYAVNSAK